MGKAVLFALGCGGVTLAYLCYDSHNNYTVCPGISGLIIALWDCSVAPAWQSGEWGGSRSFSLTLWLDFHLHKNCTEPKYRNNKTRNKNTLTSIKPLKWHFDMVVYHKCVIKYFPLYFAKKHCNRKAAGLSLHRQNHFCCSLKPPWRGTARDAFNIVVLRKKVRKSFPRRSWWWSHVEISDRERKKDWATWPGAKKRAELTSGDLQLVPVT